MGRRYKILKGSDSAQKQAQNFSNENMFIT